MGGGELLHLRTVVYGFVGERRGGRRGGKNAAFSCIAYLPRRISEKETNGKNEREIFSF